MHAGGPPLLPLDAGEQYRFAFDMNACIGCHSCEVACAEQNSNPVGVAWRRVGEIEGGSFPHTRRLNLSMACNHCLEPTCLTGCPTNAYEKLANGIVAHHAEDCIGCQYCIWNCPYEVPVFNPARRIVTKCDLCQPRLAAGTEPACVAACPTRAITVERVNVAEWRADHGLADAPGLPSAEITLSTTRIVRPPDLPKDIRSVVDDRPEPADPHWPLVWVTLLTQLSLGVLAATVALALVFGTAGSRSAGAAWHSRGGALAAAVAGLTALAVSVLHLGRPAVGWKAMRNLRRSWLSREVALFCAFAAATSGYALALALSRRAAMPSVATVASGATAVALGVAGVYASSRLYLVPARPVWNSPRTIVAFFATAAATGPLLAVIATDPAGAGQRALFAAAAAGCLLQLAALQHLVASIAARKEREFALTARLMLGPFRRLAITRALALLVALAGCTLAAVSRTGPMLGGGRASALALLAVAATGELAGRYLFFVTVTPMTAARR